ncbi:MAG: Nif3-like dinuclear metal center hexameric protein [Proteobacteria bacterium]|nr:Nif3-like dinuclear metal center hexameric protein [Pseudomonadota bacterium]
MDIDRRKRRPVVVERGTLVNHIQALLEVDRFKDYGPNGLQVEGRAEVRKVVTGVTASLALIEAAIAEGADALIVHHGLFWRGQDGRVTGWMRQRLGQLLAHDINLLAYHLPLDAHASLGNNAQWGQRLGLVAEGRFGDQDIGFIGAVPEALSLQALAERTQQAMGRAPVVVPGDGRPLRRVAWCSGGAQGHFEQAIAAGADAFLTGEISEPQAHCARETGVAFLACGHHASERYGVQALGDHLATRLGLQHTFIDVPNPA